MPKVTLYVRKDDYPKWQALKKKTKFVHEALVHSPPIEIHTGEPFDILNPVQRGMEPETMPKIIKTKEDAQKVIAQEICTGHTMGFNCGRKGCAFA